MVAGAVLKGTLLNSKGLPSLRARLIKCRCLPTGEGHPPDGISAQAEKQVPLRLRRFGMTRICKRDGD